MTLAVIPDPRPWPPPRAWIVTAESGEHALAYPVTYCGRCGQDMPADHDTHISSEAAPVAPGTAPDPQKEIHS